MDRQYLDGLARLHLTSDQDERVRVWRMSMATLAAEAAEQRPVPLEGLDPQDVLASVRSAIATGLLDDLSFLSGAHGAAALYELAAVLPIGEERRELGRRVAKKLHQGDAATFVALATQLALGSRRGLSGRTVRARVALALELPIGLGTTADALALALISRRELAQEWLVGPSKGSLPSRRLAARLLERAAREAARRCDQGDDSVLSVFSREPVRAAWQRLLADRESHVWRHVASARGLLSEHAEGWADDIVSALDPELTPTEWRRAASSLAASMAVAPQKALTRALALVQSDLFERDPGLAGIMVLGLPRAAEVEPEAAEELCTVLVRVGGTAAAQALLSLRHERVAGEFGTWACEMARAKLASHGLERSNDDGWIALGRALDHDLRPRVERQDTSSLRERLGDALSAFAEVDALAAHRAAHGVLGDVDATIGRLEMADTSTSSGRQEVFLALRELDESLLSTSTLSDLLLLGSRSDDYTLTAPLSGFFERLTNWLIDHEREPIADAESLGHESYRLQRLRTLLHAVDADGGFVDPRDERLRARRIRTANMLLTRVHRDVPCRLNRVVTASTARACDALLREEVAEASDIFVAVVRHVTNADGLDTMAEASMVPEMEAVYRAYASLVRMSSDRTSRSSGTRARASLDALRTLVRSLPAAISPRVDALHGALVAFTNAIEHLMAARSLAEVLGEPDTVSSRIRNLEAATRLLARLVVGARRRLGDEPENDGSISGAALRSIDIAAERAFRGETEALTEAADAVTEALHMEIPPHLADVASMALLRVATLPREASADQGADRTSFLPKPPKESPLPPWLPPSRTLGGFYVLRGLGAGAVGSVFIARRVEEKKNDTAPRFALKVPEYSGAAARTLSEQEFLKMFREEASALLTVPEHDNLARLVTFDAGAQPKPILVMELVEGPTLERSVETGVLDVRQTFGLLDGIAAGLAAMHEVGVGHLDVKPSNVILKGADPLLQNAGTPVLVDFGLAGRSVRPGCATANYGAPEVWGLVPKGVRADPAATDIYAFGCLAFEILTGREAISGSNEVAIITAHLSHDGDADSLRWLAQDPALSPVATVLSGALRQDPRKRTPMAELRQQLADVAPALRNHPWPLTITAAA